MRKVEQQIKKAFDEGSTKTVANTKTDGHSVWLHGNKIIERRGSEVWATLSDWNTPTTRSRLNGIIGAGYHTRKGQALRNDQPINQADWQRIS